MFERSRDHVLSAESEQHVAPCFTCNIMPPAGIHKLSPSRRGAICALRSAGFSYRAIAQQTHVSVSTAHYTVQRDQKHHMHHSLPRPGRPPTLSKRKQRSILCEIKKNCTASYQEIGDAVGDVTG